MRQTKFANSPGARHGVPAAEQERQSRRRLKGGLEAAALEATALEATALEALARRRAAAVVGGAAAR